MNSEQTSLPRHVDYGRLEAALHEFASDIVDLSKAVEVEQYADAREALDRSTKRLAGMLS